MFVQFTRSYEPFWWKKLRSAWLIDSIARPVHVAWVRIYKLGGHLRPANWSMSHYSLSFCDSARTAAGLWGPAQHLLITQAFWAILAARILIIAFLDIFFFFTHHAHLAGRDKLYIWFVGISRFSLLYHGATIDLYSISCLPW